MFEILKLAPLFFGLKVQEITILINKVQHQIQHFSNNEVLAFSGDRIEKAMILLEGKLKGEMIDYSGISLKIEGLDPPQMVAPAFLFGPQSIFPVNLSALSEGKILIIYKNDFTSLLSSDSRVLTNYLNIVSGKVQFLSHKIALLSYKTIKEKIASYLLNQLNPGSSSLIMNQSQKGLAEMFGVARPSLARTISKMEEDKIIRWERNRVIILNLKSLELILGHLA